MNSTDGGFDRYIRMETLHMNNTVSEAFDVQLTSASPSERNFDFCINNPISTFSNMCCYGQFLCMWLSQ